MHAHENLLLNDVLTHLLYPYDVMSSPCDAVLSPIIYILTLAPISMNITLIH